MAEKHASTLLRQILDHLGTENDNFFIIDIINIPFLYLNLDWDSVSGLPIWCKSCNIYRKKSFYVANKCMSINNLRSTSNLFRTYDTVAENRYKNKRLCLIFSGAHRQYINKIIFMRKRIDIICVVSGLKVLRYTDFSRIYKINADV